jgi:hypothetical protein
MGRVKTNRALAEGILRTIQRLEADPNVDPQQPAFIHLKCSLMKRLLCLEVDTAAVESSIHLVERDPSPSSESMGAEATGTD